MFLLDGKPLSPDVAFTCNDVQYPANWLRLSTPEEREAIGITETADPLIWDQRFAWGYSEDGNLIWKDHGQLIEQWRDQTRSTAGSLLQPTDWMVIREADNGSIIDPEIKAWRQDIRLAAGEKISLIEMTTSSEELAGYIASSDYYEWPRNPRLPVTEPVQQEQDTSENIS